MNANVGMACGILEFLSGLKHFEHALDAAAPFIHQCDAITIVIAHLPLHALTNTIGCSHCLILFMYLLPSSVQQQQRADEIAMRMTYLPCVEDMRIISGRHRHHTLGIFIYSCTVYCCVLWMMINNWIDSVTDEWTDQTDQLQVMIVVSQSMIYSSTSFISNWRRTTPYHTV